MSGKSFGHYARRGGRGGEGGKGESVVKWEEEMVERGGNGEGNEGAKGGER